MKINFRQYLPHVVAVLIFIIVTLVYFKPLLSGKQLSQHDIAQHKGMSKEIADYREKHHEEPLWTNSMFGGMPAYQVSTLYSGNLLSFLDGNSKHSGLMKLFLPHPGSYLFLFCLGFFILLLCLDVNPWLALVGALAYGLSTYFLSILVAGHNSKANALGYLPAMLGGIILIFRGRYWSGLVVATLFTALEINCNHVQISYYGFMIVGFLLLGFFVQAFKTKTLPVFFKAFAFFLVAVFLGILPNAGNLMTTNEYGKLSNRGKAELTIKEDGSSNQAILSGGLDKDYATNYSYGISETFSFLIPDFKGGGNRSISRVDKDALKHVNPEYRDYVAQMDVYFGDQPLLYAPDYIGAFIVFMAVVALFVVQNPIKWALFGVTVLAIMLGWGKNFMALTSFFMDVVPGYNKFRAVSMIMIIPELTIPLLAMLGINELIKLKTWEHKLSLPFVKRMVSVKQIMYGNLIVIGGFCLLGYLAPNLVNTFHASNEEAKLTYQISRSDVPDEQARETARILLPQLEIAREAVFKSDSGRSLIFILLGFGSLLLFSRGKLSNELLFASLAIFIVIDLWSVDKRYLNDSSFVDKARNQSNIAAKTAADEEILKDTDPDYRVLNLTVSPFDDASTSYYHKSIGGYHGAKLRRYVDLIDFHLRPEIDVFYRGINQAASGDSALRMLFSKLPVLNMLNTKYLILPVGQEGNSAIPIKNTQANGHAWFVSNIKFVQSADSEIVSMRGFDSKQTAIVNSAFKEALGLKSQYSNEGSIKLNSYEPNHLVYETNAKQEQFAVFSEIYYKNGWNAYIDGVLKPHAQVDYVLRGMLVPAGNHRIEFKFEPQVYQTGNTIALIGSILLFVAIGFGIYMQRRNNVIVS